MGKSGKCVKRRLCENNGVRVDNNGDFYWFGDFQNGSFPTFTVGVLSFSAPQEAGAYFLVKLNPTSGVNIWGVGGNSSDYCTGDAMDIDINNSIVISGRSAASLTLVTSTATGGLYVAKLNSTGNYTVGKFVGIETPIFDLDTDCKANIYLTGAFYGTQAFTGLSSLTSVGNTDIFTLKLNNTATGVWALRAGSSLEDSGIAIGIDGNTNVYTTGNFKSTCSFGTSSLSSSGDFDVFLAKIPTNYIVPIITGTTLICTQSGSVTLTVSNPQTGYTYNWYTVPTGGTSIATGTSYTTPTLTSTTTYYIEVVNAEFCILSRVPVTVTVNSSCCPTFIAPVINNVYVCSSGTATFTINNPQSGYLYKWYTTSTGGSPFFTGTSYTTGTLTAPYTATYYVEATNSTICPASNRMTATVTVDNCCTQVTISPASQSVKKNVDVYYFITYTNIGTSNSTINSLTSTTSTPNLTGITFDKTFPLVIPPGQSVTVIVTGQYSVDSDVYFSKCFSTTINSSCTYEVCQQTQVITGTGTSDADFTINNNIVPIRTTQAVNFSGYNLSGINHWRVRLLPSGSLITLPGTSNTVSYAFPDLGIYEVTHDYGSYTITKTINVTGENRALAFSTAEVNAGTNTNYGIGNFTLEAYVKPTTLPTALNSKSCFFSNMYNTDGFEFGVNASGKLYLQINSSIYTNTTGTTLVNGTCYHVAVARSTNSFTFYVNGTVSGSTFTTSDIPTFNEATLFIGRSAYSDGYSAGQFIGLIEDARIWSITRTQSQISSNIYKTLIGNESGLVSYWPINEGSGTIIHDIASGYNNGSLSGQTWTTLSCGGAREGNNNSTEYQQTSENVNIYPVPFTNETHLRVYSSIDEAVSLSIIDIMGSTVYKAAGLSSNTEYVLGKDLTSGIYTVIVRYGEKVEYKKIVKQ